MIELKINKKFLFILFPAIDCFYKAGVQKFSNVFRMIGLLGLILGGFDQARSQSGGQKKVQLSQPPLTTLSSESSRAAAKPSKGSEVKKPVLKGPIPPVRWLPVSAQGMSPLVVTPDIHQTMPRLRFQLTKLLSPKQVSILEGGFTTVSQLVIQLPGPSSLNQEEDEEESLPLAVHTAPIKRISCSVKFDAWEETFEVIRLFDHGSKEPSAAATPVVVKTIDEYGDACLALELDLDKSTSYLAMQGGELIATMIVKQTSLDETAKIKEWLIQQQSGVIQGLFSHMLGELTLYQVVQTKLSVPPYSVQNIGEFKK